jgi:hypothetical protein
MSFNDRALQSVFTFSELWVRELYQCGIGREVNSINKSKEVGE